MRPDAAFTHSATFRNRAAGCCPPEGWPWYPEGYGSQGRGHADRFRARNAAPANVFERRRAATSRLPSAERIRRRGLPPPPRVISACTTHGWDFFFGFLVFGLITIIVSRKKITGFPFLNFDFVFFFCPYRRRSEFLGYMSFAVKNVIKKVSTYIIFILHRYLYFNPLGHTRKL